jgi:histidinol-phosphate aminotransferase|tara:strand:- start:16808 stop:17833 length:1026 start_codon:yes stop_codon:yes gene_type:complete
MDPVTYALNVNENTHPVPPEVRQAILSHISRALETINRYPDREFTALREALASYATRSHRQGTLDASMVWAANGSNEVIQQVLQAFGGQGRSVLGFPPSYSMHPIIAESTGTTWSVGSREQDFSLTPAGVESAIRLTRPDVVFLCAPNNPTGTPVSLETIEAAYDATDGIVLVDEAYVEFHSEGSLTASELLPGRERLLVSRTMSKAFAFAGARVGYLLADPAVIDALRLVRLPYHLSGITQAAALGALENAEVMLAMVEDIRQQRDRLLQELPGLGYTVCESQANFVLFGGVENPKALFEQLLSHDILIRDVGIPHHLRVTAGTEAETSYFLETLATLAR